MEQKKRRGFALPVAVFAEELVPRGLERRGPHHAQQEERKDHDGQDEPPVVAAHAYLAHHTWLHIRWVIGCAPTMGARSPPQLYVSWRSPLMVLWSA